MRLRNGGRNPKTLYLQLGDEPDHDRDISLGYVENPHIAGWLVRELADNTAANDRLEAIVIEGMSNG